MNDQTEVDAEAAWHEEGYRHGLERAALRIEQLGGKYGSLLSPDVAAREIRALKDQ